MKKNPTVQGTFSKLFGKKHANPPATSLYATNPPWIFTQEAPEEGTRGFGKCARERGARGPPRGPPPRGRPSPRALDDPRPRGRETRQRGGEATRLNLCVGRAGAFGKGRSLGKGRRGSSPPQGQRSLRGRTHLILVPLPMCLFSLLGGSFVCFIVARKASRALRCPLSPFPQQFY